MRAKYGDWLDDLREYPAAVVADACAIWRRGNTRRPMPAEIRALCVEAMPKPPKPLALPSYGAREYETERNRQYREAAEARQRFAEQHGFQDFEAVMKRGVTSVGSGNGKAPQPAPVRQPLNTDDLLARAKSRLGIADPKSETGEVA